jgi:hypothetical protein
VCGPMPFGEHRLRYRRGRRTCAGRGPSRLPRGSVPAVARRRIAGRNHCRRQLAGCRSSRQVLLGMLARPVARVEERCGRWRPPIERHVVAHPSAALRTGARSNIARRWSCPWPAPVLSCRRHAAARRPGRKPEGDHGWAAAPCSTSQPDRPALRDSAAHPRARSARPAIQTRTPDGTGIIAATEDAGPAPVPPRRHRHRR